MCRRKEKERVKKKNKFEKDEVAEFGKRERERGLGVNNFKIVLKIFKRWSGVFEF